MGKGPPEEGCDVGGTSAYVDQHDARLAVGVEQAGFGGGQWLEHDLRDPDAAILDRAQKVLDARDRPAHDMGAHGDLAGGEAHGVLDAFGAIEDVAAGDYVYHPLVLVQVELPGLLFELAHEPVGDRQVPAAIQEGDLGVERGDVAARDAHRYLAAANAAGFQGFGDRIGGGPAVYHDAPLEAVGRRLPQGHDLDPAPARVDPAGDRRYLGGAHVDPVDQRLRHGLLSSWLAARFARGDDDDPFGRTEVEDPGVGMLGHDVFQGPGPAFAHVAG